jgi:hypothetical protein
VEFDNFGVGFLPVGGDVERSHGDEGKLDVLHFKVLAKEFRQGIAAGQGWVDSDEESNGDGVVHVHAVEGEPVIVVGQPVKQLLVELEVGEEGCGFKGKEENKLFLCNDSLQVHDIFFNGGFRNLGDVFDLIDGGA